MENETCEGCNRTAEDLDCAWLCKDCQDKAASYDITALERKKLANTIAKVLSMLDELAPSYAIGEIVGRLKAVLENCCFKVEETVEIPS